MKRRCTRSPSTRNRLRSRSRESVRAITGSQRDRMALKALHERLRPHLAARERPARVQPEPATPVVVPEVMRSALLPVKRPRCQTATPPARNRPRCSVMSARPALLLALEQERSRSVRVSGKVAPTARPFAPMRYRRADQTQRPPRIVFASAAPARQCRTRHGPLSIPSVRIRIDDSGARKRRFLNAAVEEGASWSR